MNENSPIWARLADIMMAVAGGWRNASTIRKAASDFTTICPHKGYPLNYNANTRTLNCSGHYSVFDCEAGGQVVAGRATARTMFNDRSPGVEESEPTASYLSYTAGLGLAILATIASFVVSQTNLLWAPGIPVGLVVLAFAQIGVHLVFFLHLGTGPDHTNNILALAFGVLIVFLVITGSIWIIANLNSVSLFRRSGKGIGRPCAVARAASAAACAPPAA